MEPLLPRLSSARLRLPGRPHGRRARRPGVLGVEAGHSVA